MQIYSIHTRLTEHMKYNINKYLKYLKKADKIAHYREG